MSIASVVTRGFNHSVSSVVVRGYSIGAPPPPPPPPPPAPQPSGGAGSVGGRRRKPLGSTGRRPVRLEEWIEEREPETPAEKIEVAQEYIAYVKTETGSDTTIARINAVADLIQQALDYIEQRRVELKARRDRDDEDALMMIIAQI